VFTRLHGIISQNIIITLIQIFSSVKVQKSLNCITEYYWSEVRKIFWGVLAIPSRAINKLSRTIYIYIKTVSFLITKPTRCTNYSIYFWLIKLYMFRRVPLSIISSFSLYTQKWFMSYMFAVCTVRNSWWWTEELSDTCKIFFQK